jgi:hypothetical protein
VSKKAKFMETCEQIHKTSKIPKGDLLCLKKHRSYSNAGPQKYLKQTMNI